MQTKFVWIYGHVIGTTYLELFFVYSRQPVKVEKLAFFPLPFGNELQYRNSHF